MESFEKRAICLKDPIEQEVFMNEQFMKGIKCVSRLTRPASDMERENGKKRMPVAARVAACLLMIGVLLPAALCVAAQQDPREAAIAADLAAGTDIAVIIRNAVAAGLSVERAVGALVTAGADPGRVAYVAITANFPASDVVRGASNAVQRMGLSDAAVLTQITTIVSAATTAGAAPSQVNSGLSNAGVPPAVIANANARAASAPVYGYTAPTAPAPATSTVIGAAVGGGGGGAIGGSGVGAPPTSASRTQPASPTKPVNQP